MSLFTFPPNAIYNCNLRCKLVYIFYIGRFLSGFGIVCTYYIHRTTWAAINPQGLQTVIMLGGFASVTIPAKSYLAEARPMFGKRNQRPSTLNSSPPDGTMVLLLPGHWQGVIYPEDSWGVGGVDPRKCWIMVRQSWDCCCSLLFLVNSVPQRRPGS